MRSADLRRAVSEAVREAIGQTSSTLPPPCDLDAEGELVSAALCGHVDPGELTVVGRDFYSAANGYLWHACDAVRRADLPCTPERVLAALEAGGYQGPDLRAYALQLRDEVPALSRTAARERAARVVALADARRLLEHVGWISGALRAGWIGAAEARRELSKEE